MITICESRWRHLTKKSQRLRELQAADRRELTNYGWIDRQQGQVRIPIDRAMDLLAEETDAEQRATADIVRRLSVFVRGLVAMTPVYVVIFGTVAATGSDRGHAFWLGHQDRASYEIFSVALLVFSMLTNRRRANRLVSGSGCKTLGRRFR